MRDNKVLKPEIPAAGLRNCHAESSYASDGSLEHVHGAVVVRG